MKCLVTLVFFTSCLTLSASPKNLKVIEGDAKLLFGSNNHLLIEAGDHSILHWSDFSIKEHEKVEFALPSIDSAVLNRVVGTKKSVLDGTLLSNGNVFLINPNGILIGPNGLIEVGGFVASTLDIVNTDFLNKKEFVFNGSSRLGVINYGEIKTAYGPIALLGRCIVNKGKIEGQVLIGAGEEVVLKLGKNPNILVRTTHSPSEVQDELKRGASPFQYGIDQSGTIDALSFSTENGQVILKTTDNITVGGEIFGDTEMEASRIEVLGSIQSPSGDIRLSSETLTFVGAHGSLSVQGKQKQDGGSIYLGSEGITEFLGKADLCGGAIGGGGGSIALFGKNDLVFEGALERVSPKGDPGSLTLNTSAPVIISGNNHFQPIQEGMQIPLDTLILEVEHGPVKLSSKGSVTLDKEIDRSYTSPYSLSLSSKGIEGITLLGSLKNKGNGPLTFNAYNSDLILQGRIESKGDLTLESGGQILLAGTHSKPSLLKTSAGNIKLSALKGIDLFPLSQIETQEGNLLFSSAGPISFQEKSKINLSGQGSITFQGLSKQPIESLSLKEAQIKASVHSNSFHVDPILKGVHMDSATIYIGSGGVDFKGVGGDIHIQGKTAPAGIFSDGHLEVNVQGNLILDALQNEAFLQAHKKIQLIVGQDYLSNADLAHAKTTSLQSISIAGQGHLILNGMNAGTSSVAAPAVSIGLARSAHLFSNSSIVAEKGPLLLSTGSDITLSNPFNISQPLIVADQLTIHSLGRIIFKNNAQVQAKSGALLGDEGLFLYHQALIAAEVGSLFLSSSQGNIQLSGYSELKTFDGSLEATAGGSIILNHFSKISALGKGGATFLVNKIQKQPSGGMIVGKHASIVTGEKEKLNIYSASRNANSIEGTLNGERVDPSPLYLATNEEVWGVSFTENSRNGPPSKPVHKNPLVEFIKNSPFTQAKQPSFTIFYEESPGLIGKLFSPKDFSLIAINFVGPYISELFRYLHPYNEFTETYLDFNTRYTHFPKQRIQDTLNSFDILGETTYLIRRNTFRYNRPISMLQNDE